MKKIIFFTMISMVIAFISSCKPELDNYAAPAETLTGKIIDSSTGLPIQLESGSGGSQIRMDEISWGANVTPWDFNVMMDGTFNNTKIFAGTYRVYPFGGPYVPIYLVSTTTPIDKRDTTVIKGIVTKEFTVDPFLKVQWVGTPVLNADSTVTIQCRFDRGTTNPAFQFNVSDVYFYVNNTPFVGGSSFDANMSTQVVYSGTAGNALLGTTVSITSKTTKKFKGGPRTYYLRIGARTADNINKRYNYTDVKAFTIPAK
jgi:hypothetical protein